jgi:N-acetylglucosamine kinase-like BadF-type ATPase
VQYFLGVDGGGTKAAYVLSDRNGEVVGLHIARGFARTLHSTTAIVSQIMQQVEHCLAENAIDLSQIGGVCFGLPCFGELSEKDRETSLALQSEFNSVNCYITNDCEVGWAGSLAGRPGVNIVAGTGSIAYGRNSAGKAVRVGGWFPFFGDEGSCYWLGRKTMELFSKQADGRVPRGALYDIVREEFSLREDFEFIELMEDGVIPARENVAKLQILLESAAIEGDTSVIPLYEKCTDELTLCISTAADQLGFLGSSFPVSFSGGLFKPGSHERATSQTKEEQIVSLLRDKVSAIGGVLQEPLLKPYQGAVLCALKNSHPELLERATKTMLENR